jgi:hypothetical protein
MQHTNLLGMSLQMTLKAASQFSDEPLVPLNGDCSKG